MGKAPAIQLYVNDFTRDMEDHPLEIVGAWILIMCKLWHSPTRGRMTRTVDQWARILRVNTDKAKELLVYIKNERIGDVTLCSENITVTNRRMYRDYKEKESNRLRQEKWRQQHGHDEKITPPSSSSSSSSNNISPASPDLDKKIRDGTHGDKCDAIIRACRNYLKIEVNHAQAGKINQKAESVGQAIVAIYRAKEWIVSKKHFVGAVVRELQQSRGSTDAIGKCHPGWPDADWDMVKAEDKRFEELLDQKYGNKLGDVFARVTKEAL